MEEKNSIKNSVILKLILVGFVALILLIPTASISNLISERQDRRDEAIKEVTSKWGDKQTIAGPILTVPYKVIEKDADKKISETVKYAHFLPEDLNVSGNLAPNILNRGIYKVIAYKADLKFDGKFLKPDFSELNIPADNIIWKDAFVSIGVPDMRGINENIVIKWNDKDYQALPASGPMLVTLGRTGQIIDENGNKISEAINVNEDNPNYNPPVAIKSGVSVSVPLESATSSGKAYAYSFKININGGEQLNFIPIGSQTNVALTSSWTNPSFDGAFLPVEREVSKDGFKANWKVLLLNRNFGESWLDNNDNGILDSTFGVRMIVPVDEYQKNMRSVKYAIMLIALTFLIFFFVEVINRIRIHPIQYLLVGFALLLFFTLLLSISEHLGFNPAYLIASLATISLVVFYIKHVFKNSRLTGMFAGIMVMIYLFIFTIIQLQDYALLMGSIGLFAVLAIIMFISRKINWYAIGAKDGEER
jgi:inner membrane protein